MVTILENNENIKDLQECNDEEFFSFLQELFESKTEECISITDQNRLLQVRMSFDSFKKVFDGQHVSVDYKLNEPFVSMGAIYANGKSITIKNRKLFLRACKLASNVDIYPKTDGTIMIALTFRGLTKMVK